MDITTRPLSFFNLISIKLVSLLTLLPSLALLYFGLQLVNAPETLVVQYVPDDAYYYMTLARNFTRFGTWTFDSGNSLTTGFHPLLAYILAGIYEVLHPSDALFVRLGIMFGVLLTAIFALFALRFALSQKQPAWLLTLLLIATSQNIAYNSVSIVEWSLVVAMAGLLVYGYWVGWRSPILLIIGIMGSLARSDFGMLPACMTGVTILLFFLKHKGIDIRRASAGLLGAGIGVGLTFIHNAVFTGNWLQSSAQVKSFWSQQGSPLTNASAIHPFFVLGINHPVTALVVFALIIVILLAVFIRFRTISHQLMQLSGRQPRALVLLLSCVLTILGYVVFYSHNAEIQAWYTANEVVPMAVVWAAGMAVAWASSRGRKLLIILTLLAVVSNLWTLITPNEGRAPYPIQLDMLYMGEQLATEPLNMPVGAWNAGILGFVTDGRVINLDGLVNNDIYPYLISNRLPDYILIHVGYIADFPVMLNEYYRRRGGYDVPTFVSSLEEIGRQGNMILWQVGGARIGSTP